MSCTDPGDPQGSSQRERAATPDAAAEPPFHSVGFMLSSLGYAVAKRFRETLAPLNLEPREFALLRAVGACEGQSQQTLGDRLLIPASRMVAFVDALEARGLLERQPNPEDRRARALYLTQTGRELLGEAFSLALAFERRLCAEIGEQEREQLIDTLRRVGAQIGLPEDAGAAHAIHAAALDDEAAGC